MCCNEGKPVSFRAGVDESSLSRTRGLTAAGESQFLILTYLLTCKRRRRKRELIDKSDVFIFHCVEGMCVAWIQRYLSTHFWERREDVSFEGKEGRERERERKVVTDGVYIGRESR